MTNEMPRSYEARLLRVLAYMHDHLDEDVSLDTLAEVACLSRFHWHRVYVAMTGETPAETLRRLRLQKAANALVQGEGPVAKVAERHGYANLASFSRAFRAAHGLAPGEMKALGRELQSHPGDDNMYPVTIQDLPPSRAAGVAHIGPYGDLARAFQQLGGVIFGRNLAPHVRGMIAVYHDAPGSKPDGEMKAHAAVIVDEAFPVALEGLEVFDLPGGKHAVLEHSGTYATLGSAYEWLYGRWLPASGEEPRDAPPVELYLNDPRDTPPEALRTDIRLPLA